MHCTRTPAASRKPPTPSPLPLSLLLSPVARLPAAAAPAAVGEIGEFDEGCAGMVVGGEGIETTHPPSPGFRTCGVPAGVSAAAVFAAAVLAAAAALAAAVPD